MGDPEDMIATQLDAATWDGEMVGWTEIRCMAAARNPYVAVGTSGWVKYIARTIFVNPNGHRPGWNIVSTFGQSDTAWMQSDPTWFPILNAASAYGQNTNQDNNYKEANTIIVTPIYNDQANYSADYSAFDSMVEAIATGPNAGLWYNSDPALFKVARMARFNYWISPSAAAPPIPATDPNGNAYTNWLTLQANLLQDICTCTNPSAHGGIGNNIRWIANTWHEKYGCPSSPNQVYLGHQAQIEDALSNGADVTYDAAYLCDLNYARTKEELRALDMGSRASAQNGLYGRAMSVHAFIGTPWDRHNFKGNMWVYKNGAWMLTSGAFGGCY